MTTTPAAPAGLLATPGAGSDRDHVTLVALEEQLPLPVERVDFPYRRQGRKVPDRAPKLVDFITTEAPLVADRLGVAPEQLVLGGRSMGGRICSMAVAAGVPAAGLVLLSYPLHPPGKPDKLRIEHLPDLGVPCLFLSGERDPFGSPEELEAHAAVIPGPVTLRFLPGRHEVKGLDEEIVAIVSDWLASLRS